MAVEKAATSPQTQPGGGGGQARPGTATPAAETDLESSVQSVWRACQILGAFTPDAPELGVTELSRRVSLHKSTVSRLLSALRHGGLVVQVPGTGRYRLGMRVVELATVALRGLDLVELARDAMADVQRASGETVTLTVIEGASKDGGHIEGATSAGIRCVDLATVDSPYPLRVVRAPGQTLPLAASAAGRILLAVGGPRVRALWTAAQAPDLSPAELETLRDTGYAVVYDGWAPGVVELAAPVWDHVGRAVAGLTLSAPASRMDDERLRAGATVLKSAAATLSRRLGYREA